MQHTRQTHMRNTEHRTHIWQTYIQRTREKHTWERYMKSMYEKHYEKQMRGTNMRNRHAKNKYEKQTCEEYIRSIHEKHKWQTCMEAKETNTGIIREKHTSEAYVRSIWMRNIHIHWYTIIFMLHEEIHENHSWETYMNKNENIPSVAFSVRSKLGGTLTVLPKEGCTTFKLQRFSELRPFTMPQAELNGTTGTTNLFPHFLLTCQLLSELMHLSRHLKKPYMLPYAPQTGHHKNSHPFSTSDSLLISHVGQVVKAVEILRFRCRFGLCRCSDNRWWLRR